MRFVAAVNSNELSAAAEGTGRPARTEHPFDERARVEGCPATTALGWLLRAVLDPPAEPGPPYRHTNSLPADEDAMRAAPGPALTVERSPR